MAIKRLRILNGLVIEILSILGYALLMLLLCVLVGGGV